MAFYTFHHVRNWPVADGQLVGCIVLELPFHTRSTAPFSGVARVALRRPDVH